MSAKLSVNLNAIAWLRNRRDLPWPNLMHFGRLALHAGAAGLTVHPRPDERHIRFADLSQLRELIDEEFPFAEFNIEGYPNEEFLCLAERYGDQITLVPDDANQSTSDHGWDFVKSANLLEPIIQRLKDKNIRVSLFANPDIDGLEIAKKIGADRVEFFTGPYGGTYEDAEKQAHELDKLVIAAQAAKDLKLGVNAGHDLTVANIPALVKRIDWLDEVSIGHALVADSLEYGMKATVHRFINALA